MAEPITELRVANPPVELNLLACGNPQQPCLVMVHGLRDTAWALAPVAQALAAGSATHPGYYVVIMELRGHGASSHSDGYAMANFLMDLHLVIDAVCEDADNPQCALFGHSLGGHLVSRYAALFAERVRALLVVEGLGPPRAQTPVNASDRQAENDKLAAYTQMLLARMAPSTRGATPIASIDAVVERLLRNNPRLPSALAEVIAPHLVYPVEGGYRWAFDKRASSVFLGTSEEENSLHWRHIEAPTCLISGSLSWEYWGREVLTDGSSGHFAEGEMEQRLAHFRHAEHHWFEHSGHMVHYDEPERLTQLTQQFLERHYG